MQLFCNRKNPLFRHTHTHTHAQGLPDPLYGVTEKTSERSKERKKQSKEILLECTALLHIWSEHHYAGLKL